jgi:hypothetical protein
VTAATDQKARVDPGGVKGGVVLLVAAATALVMGLGVIVAWEIERSGTRRLNEHPVASRFGAPPADMNGIEMSLLAPGAGPPPRSSRPAPAAAATVSGSAATEERLKQYGWTDKDRGRVHIPLQRALELYLAREGTAARGAALGPASAPQRTGGRSESAPNDKSRGAP